MQQILEPVSVCVVTFNSGTLMLDCLLPLADRGADVTVKVWDNGSTDGVTPQILMVLKSRGLIDELHLSPEDPGFGIGANQLIRRSSGQAVLLLNPDARLDLDCLSQLRTAAAQDRSIGVVSPVLRGDGDIQVMSAGRQPRLWPLFTHYSGLSRLFPAVPFFRGRHLFLAKHGEENQDAEWTSGACLLIPRATIERVGLLSERWFMYGEDLQYCQRVLDAGLHVRVLAAAQAHHAVGASTASKRDDVVDEASPLSAVYTEAPLGGVGPPPDVTGMWGTNTYDYYVSQFEPNAAQRLAWRIVFSGGLAGRAGLRLLRNRDDRLAKKMLENATAVW